MNVTREDWERKGAELFGSDKATWRFRCPICGTEISIAEARERYPELKGKGWAPHQECIGRFLPRSTAPRMLHDKKTPCDWCAYGLFRGPVVVAAAKEDGTKCEVPVFDFAGQPFTAAVKP